LATRPRSDPLAQTRETDLARHEPISPELVLVSPQLRLKALAALPERPWESFLPPAPAAPPPSAAAAVAAPIAEPPSPTGPTPTPPSPSRDRHLGRGISLVALGLLAGLMVAEFAPRAAGPALETGAETAATVRLRPPAPAPKPTHPARPTQIRHAAWSRPVAGGGYVFANGGRFRVARNLRSIDDFRARVACGRTIRVPSVRLRSRRFSYRGRLRVGGRPLRITLLGRFVDRATAHIAVHTRSSGCDSGPLKLVARLS